MRRVHYSYVNGKCVKQTTIISKSPYVRLYGYIPSSLAFIINILIRSIFCFLYIQPYEELSSKTYIEVNCCSILSLILSIAVPLVMIVYLLYKKNIWKYLNVQVTYIMIFLLTFLLFSCSIFGFILWNKVPSSISQINMEKRQLY